MISRSCKELSIAESSKRYGEGQANARQVASISWPVPFLCIQTAACRGLPLRAVKNCHFRQLLPSLRHCKTTTNGSDRNETWVEIRVYETRKCVMRTYDKSAQRVAFCPSRFHRNMIKLDDGCLTAFCNMPHVVCYTSELKRLHVWYAKCPVYF